MLVFVCVKMCEWRGGGNGGRVAVEGRGVSLCSLVCTVAFYPRNLSLFTLRKTTTRNSNIPSPTTTYM